ncbi:MAG: hypothetical protein ACK500_04395 [Flavobacteriales bacterium]|jgi:hypothetical protein
MASDICAVNDKKFPQFRRWSNGKNYYHLISPEEMIEIQVIGGYWTEHHIHAAQYPEKLHIRDLLECVHDGIEQISEREFNGFLEECRTIRTRRDM